MRKSLLILLLGAQMAAAQVPSVPDDTTRRAIQQFLLHNRILDTPQALERAPYIVASSGGRVLGGDGDVVYARGSLDPVQSAYGIFRRGRDYTDPHTGELLGISADDIGTARFLMTDNVTALSVQRITREIRPGDRLLSAQTPIDIANIVIHKPVFNLDGQIIDVPRGVTQIGVLDAVTLNKGRRDGLTEGHLLSVKKTGETVRDRVTGAPTKIPDTCAGTLLVFRTFEKLSYALVLEASGSLAVLDRFTSGEPLQ